MSITNKLNYLRETKELIKQAIIDKGVKVNENDNFRSYSAKISAISGADPRNTLNVNSDKAKYFYYQADGDNAFFNVYGINWNAWYEDFNNYDIVIPESIGKNNEPTIYNSNITNYTKPSANFFRDTPHSYTIDKNARFKNDKLRIKAENGGLEYITKSIDVPETVKDISSFASASLPPYGLRSDQQIVVNLGSNVENLAYAFSCSNVYKVNFDKAVNIQDLSYCFAGRNYTYAENIYNQEIDLRHLIKKDIHMGSFLKNTRVFNKPIYFPDSVGYLEGCFDNATNFNQDIILPNNGQYSSLAWFLCNAYKFRSNVTIPKNATKTFNLYYAFYNTKIQNLIVDNETFKVSNLVCAFHNSLLNHIPQWFNNVLPTVNINSTFRATQISNIDLSNALAVNFISTFAGCHKIQGDILFNAPINLYDCFDGSFTNKDNIYTNSIIYKDKNNLTDISYMFGGCSGFNGNIELNDCPKLENISSLFSSCYSFNKPVNFVGSPNIIYAGNAFYNTTSFNQEVNLAEQKKLVNISGILYNSGINSPINFANCISLYNIDNAFRNLRQMNSEVNFYGCTSVKSIGNSFNSWVKYNRPFNFQWFPNLISGHGWCFSWHEFNQEVNISNLPQLTTLENCFYYCSSLDKDIIIDNCPKLTTLSNFLHNCNNFNSNFIVTNCPSITSIDSLFSNCSSFNQELKIDYPSVTSMRGLFYGCYSLDKPITFNIGVSKSLGSSFQGCSIFNQPINIKSISPVITDVGYMFADCRMFNQPIDLSSSFTLTDASYMLHNDTSFDQPVNLSGCTNLNNVSFMFSNCSKFNKEVNIQGCLNLNNFSSTFKNCYKFNQPIKFENNRLFLNNAFENCYELKQVINIPDGQTTIGSNAFYECTNAIVELPTSITSIAKRAFEGVPELRYKGTLNAAANSNWGALSLVTDW